MPKGLSREHNTIVEMNPRAVWQICRAVFFASVTLFSCKQKPSARNS